MATVNQKMWSMTVITEQMLLEVMCCKDKGVLIYLT